MSIDVLTPSLGYARFLRDAIESVRRQKDVAVRHVIQDGGSEDGTVELLESYDGIVDWESLPDRGQSDGLNRALARSDAEWIAWLNADEFYLPHGLRTLAATAKATGADVVYADAVFVDAEGRVLRLLAQHRFSALTLRSYGTFIPSCATLIRRAALDAEPWDKRLRMIMDWDLCLSLLSAGALFAYVPVPVAAFRVHQARVTASPASDFSEEYALVADRHGLRLSRPRRALGKVQHGLHKLAGGAYARQLRALRATGADLRWFESVVGPNGATSLVSACAGTRRRRR
jgi:glycosyltransferase involved in cell wall biosynthesis